MFFKIASLALSYLIGAIPSGYLLVKSIYGIDPRKHGSGNIGATNVARITGNKALFFATFFIDAFKAATAVYFAQAFFHNHYLTLLSAGCVLMGNGYSCFLGFGGGKGISTMVGILSILARPMLLPYGFVTFCLIWISFIAIRRIPAGIASVCAIWTFFIFYCWRTFDISSLVGIYSLGALSFQFTYHDIATTLFLFCAFCWITLRHWRNIAAFYNQTSNF